MRRLRVGLIRIRTGGQTGVDRAALQLAVELGIPYCGWCPRGGWAEDSTAPPGIRERYPLLAETPSADPRQRTAWNVRDSNATLILTKDGSESPGTQFTRACAELVFERPICVVDIEHSQSLTDARHWLVQLLGASATSTLDLNIAGPRESEIPGITSDASRALRAILVDAMTE